MRWDRLTVTALGGVVAFVMGRGLLLEDERPMFAPAFGMVGSIARHGMANHDRHKLRVDALENRLAQREWRERAGGEWDR